MIKTVEQYLESLNDGREVWCLGEKVADVRTHPTVSTIIETASMDYVLPNHPDYRDLFVTQDEDGEDINFLLTSPKTPEDMLRRRECYTVGIRSGGGVIVHCMGADALAAFTVAAQVMDKQAGDRVYGARRAVPPASAKERSGHHRRHYGCEGGPKPSSLKAETAPGLLPEDRGPAEGRHRGPGRQSAYQCLSLRQ